jgi:pre-mRNA cleavage complex 2 protein Pcf11
MESENAAAEELFAETIHPSIPTGTDEDSCCQVCHEPFEQFYNDEKEEWHLRPAICFENKNFHPLCLEDHKVSQSIL